MRYQNPIIRGFSPDPSICRKGKDYYLVTSSFEYFPGLPLYHSTDLVNWEQVGNCISFDNALSFKDAAESGGLWAPTIRCLDDCFFVTCTMEGKGNFIIYTKDIVKGSWSEPVWISVGGIDPSLFFEKGRAYYCTNYHPEGCGDSISLGVVDPFSGEIMDPFRTVWQGTGGGALEAPHIYHIGEWYYILGAEGGTFANHMITAGRSRNIWGPYENCPDNPILTNRADFSWQVQGSGHGDMVEDAQGNWWMVHLGNRVARRTMSHLGRETFLTPFRWEGGWPVFGNDRKARLAEEGPLLCEQKPFSDFRDDFEDSEWKCWQQFLRNPNLENFERGMGYLKIRPSAGFSDHGSPGMLCMRQPDFCFTMQVELEFAPCQEGDEAGIVIYHTHQFYCAFGIRRKEGRPVLFVERRAEDLCQVSMEKEAPEGKNVFVITGDALQYSFFIEKNGSKRELLCTASTRFLSSEVIGRTFTGTMLSLYAKSDQKTEAEAKFRRLVIMNVNT